MSDNENLLVNKLKEAERYKNAERLAKSLKSYLPPSMDKAKSRGRSKDKRICQLSAAFKYIIHLEKTIKDLNERLNSPTPENCTLVHNTTNLNNSNLESSLNVLQAQDLNDLDTETSCITPIRKKFLLHESSQISATTSSTSLTSLCNTGNQQATNVLNQFTNFKSVDASPIYGSQNHFLIENENFDEFDPSKRPNKRRLIDENNNSLGCIDMNYINDANKENKRPKNSPNNSNLSKSQTKTNNSKQSSTNDPEVAKSAKLSELDEIIGRKHYFLRSTNRLRNMLIANMNKSASTSNLTAKNQPKLNTQYSRLNSSMTSTRISSTTTTPSIRSGVSGNMSSTSTTSNDFDGLDTRQLLRANLSQDQVANLFETNQQDLKNPKDSFGFI